MLSAQEAARTGVLVVSESERGTLVVAGRDRQTWLNGIVTCDVVEVVPGQGALGLILSKAGKVMSDLLLVASADSVFVSVASGKHAELRDYLDRMLVMEDAELRDGSESHTWLALHGPRAAGAAEAAAVRAVGASGSIDWTGLGGAALVVEQARLEQALAAVREHSPDVVSAGPEDWTQLRIERGVSVYGVDYGPEDNPHEAALDQRAVSWTKGCYLGQEVVCMQGMRGKVKRRVVSLHVDGMHELLRGTPLCAPDQAEVGEVTSASASEKEGCVVALGRVSGAALDAHLALSAAGRAATIVERPAAL